MKNSGTTNEKRHPYLREELIKKRGLFQLINRDQKPGIPLMTEQQWNEFCDNRWNKRVVREIIYEMRGPTSFFDDEFLT